MIADFFIKLINTLIETLSFMANAVFMILPESPFNNLNFNIESNLLRSLNWLIPLDNIIIILSSWITVIFIIYVMQIILKWVKAL